MMYRVSLFLALIVSLLLIGCASQKYVPKENGNRVLLILRGGGTADRQELATDEAVVMRNMLEEAGFEVVATSVRGQKFVHGDIIIESNLRLAEAKATDYKGFILPCLGIGTWSAPITPEAIAIVKQAVAEEKLIAAQRGAVPILAKAGVLKGRRYAFLGDILIPDAIYGGTGVVQDGNIITAAICTDRARPGLNDQTAELTQAFIAELQK